MLIIKPASRAGAQRPLCAVARRSRLYSTGTDG